jgi:hypothetical protein
MKLHEFVSPLAEFREQYNAEQKKAKDAAREARLNYRDARREYKYIKQGVSDNPNISAMQDKLHADSYVRRGAGVGAGLGLLAGAAAGRRDGIPGILFKAPAGALMGAWGGLEIGGRIRKGEKKQLSANLKSNLRELAAISEGLKEFAVVRDANGQYIEVEDEGGLGIKAGAGAASLGGAGYGAYRADKAIMSKYGNRGLIENIDPKLPAQYAKTSAAGTAAATRGQAYRSAFKDATNQASSRFNQGLAAGKTAYARAGSQVAGKLPVEAGGFGAKLLRGIRKGLSVAIR